MGKHQIPLHNLSSSFVLELFLRSVIKCKKSLEIFFLLKANYSMHFFQFTPKFQATAKLRPCAPRYAPVRPGTPLCAPGRPNAPRGQKNNEKA